MDFGEHILQWYRVHGRELPWRGTRDPYRIWLSEVILQQTRITQGMDYWLRFVERWPMVHDLAHASEDEVLREWQGLGYYSRARNLHQAAQQIDQMGDFPQTLDGLRSLKGVGDYTAAAIASMAFGIDAAVVDGTSVSTRPSIPPKANDCSPSWRSRYYPLGMPPSSIRA